MRMHFIACSKPRTRPVWPVTFLLGLTLGCAGRSAPAFREGMRCNPGLFSTAFQRPIDYSGAVRQSLPDSQSTEGGEAFVVRAAGRLIAIRFIDFGESGRSETEVRMLGTSSFVYLRTLIAYRDPGAIGGAAAADTSYSIGMVCEGAPQTPPPAGFARLLQERIYSVQPLNPPREFAR